MELKNSQSIVFNILTFLTFYKVLSCVLIETVMCISALHIAPFEVTASVNTKTPWWWHPGSAKTCRKGNCVL